MTMRKATTVECPDCKRLFSYNDATDEYLGAPWEPVALCSRNWIEKTDETLEADEPLGVDEVLTFYQARCLCGQRIAMCCQDDNGLDVFKRL